MSSGGTFISRIAAGTTGDPNYLNGYTTTQFPVPANSSDITVGPAGGVYVVSDASNTVTYLTGSGNNYATATGWPNLAGVGGINNPKAIAIDGRLISGQRTARLIAAADCTAWGRSARRERR